METESLTAHPEKAKTARDTSPQTHTAQTPSGADVLLSGSSTQQVAAGNSRLQTQKSEIVLKITKDYH